MRICARTETSSDETASSQTIERRVGRERPGDRDALALAAGELQRPPPAEVGLEADELEQLGHAARGAARASRRAEEQERLGDDLLDRHHRVERVARILEDHLHAAALLLRDAAARWPRAAAPRTMTAAAGPRR